MKRALLRRRRELAISVAVILIFVLALVLWAGRAPKGYSGALPSGAGGSAGAGPSNGASTLPGASRSPSPSASPSVAATVPGGLLTLPNLVPLPGSTDIRDASHLHNVRITVTSDKPILQLAYAIKSKPPTSAYRTYVQSPSTIAAVGYGEGVVAQVGAQANVNATYIACSVSVDGVVKNSRRVQGAYAVAFCVA